MSVPPPSPRTSTPETLDTTIRPSSPAKDSSDAPDSSPSPEISAGKPGVPVTESMHPQPKPRRYLPQPIEESSRSSHRKNAEHRNHTPDLEHSSQERRDQLPSNTSDGSLVSGGQNTQSPSAVRRFKAEPIETSTRSSRRKFAPEPIETSTRKSKDKPASKVDEAGPKPRRKFTPEPVETTSRSSKGKQAHKQEDDIETTPRPRRKFAPDPIETTTTVRRRRRPELRDSDEEIEPTGSGPPDTASRESTGPRKFSPELLETAKGSYRRVHLPSPKSNRPPSNLTPPVSEGGEVEETDELTGLEESKFSAASLARKHPEITRQHSFAVPDLPMIESTSEYESSDTPSLSDSPSSFDTENIKSTNVPDPQESYTEYVLRLAAETVTEKELQEQAMAAYINERPHEPVDHFAISHDEDDDGPLHEPMFQGEKGVDVKTFRRSSAAELDLEMANMRKHHEQLESAKRELKADTAGHSRFSAAALATRHALEAKSVKKTKKARADEDFELARMRAAASPPMLGTNIVFPFTISPKMTRCDPDQAPRPRNADSDDEVPSPQSPHLWKTGKTAGNNGGEGLWMGLCQASQFQPSSVQNGLRSGIQTPAPQTPAIEKNNPFESAVSVRGNQTPGRGNQTPGRRRAFPGVGFIPLTPPRSQDGEDMFTSTIDRKLQIEKKIEEEFPSQVITQIYNYLSLGYPSLAHTFDEELSKISRISIEELRRDDYNVDAKGYIGAPEGGGVDESEVIGKCKRWEALKLYVREWARQSPNFADDRSRPVGGANEDWGARARKGSWGH